MADGILGLGSGQASTLNQEMLDKLKEADREALVVPIETDIEDLATEQETISTIKSKYQELLETIKPFDLYVTTGVTAFDLKTANATGDSVIFDSEDDSKLNTGTTSVTITSLATRDVYESAKFTDPDQEIFGSDSSDDTLTITVDGTDYEFETNGKTYQELADEINNYSKFDATVETVGTDEYRLVIKSEESGLDNALTISSAGSLQLGFEDNISLATTEFTSTDTAASGSLVLDGMTFTLDGTQTYDDLVDDINASSGGLTAAFVGNTLMISKDDGTAVTVGTDDFGFGLENDVGGHPVSASNLVAEADGVDYNISSNEFIVGGGLKVTAVEPGTSTITISKDSTSIESLLQDFVTKYNELVDLVDAELLSVDSKVDDKSTLRSIMAQIKETLFDNYGTEDDLNIFNFGFSTDKSGYLTLNSSDFDTALSENYDDIKNLFVGLAEDEGLGTKLKTYVDALDGFDGLITAYEDNMTDREEALEEEKEKAVEALDTRYASMAQQFADYGVIINQMEASFSGLKMLIDQSTS